MDLLIVVIKNMLEFIGTEGVQPQYARGDCLSSRWGFIYYKVTPIVIIIMWNFILVIGGAYGACQRSHLLYQILGQVDILTYINLLLGNTYTNERAHSHIIKFFW